MLSITLLREEVIMVEQEHISIEDGKGIEVGGLIQEESDQLDILDDILQLQVQNEVLQNELRLVRRSWLWSLVGWLA